MTLIAGNASSAAPTPARSAGLRRRFLAFFLDAIAVVLVLTLSSLLFMELNIDLGSAGPVVGVVMILAYFTVSNSRLMAGSGPGKRFTGIAVVGADGAPLPVWAAALRSGILLGPFLIDNSLPAGVPEWVYKVNLGFSAHQDERSFATSAKAWPHPVFSGTTRQSRLCSGVRPTRGPAAVPPHRRPNSRSMSASFSST